MPVLVSQLTMQLRDRLAEESHNRADGKVSGRVMLFKDRLAAGWLLADELVRSLSKQSEKVRTLPVVIVALPRGLAPVAFPVACRFCTPLEIGAAKKLPYPNDPEFAMVAVSSEGVVILNKDIPPSSE